MLYISNQLDVTFSQFFYFIFATKRVISSSQRPLPDNTHNRQTSMPPIGFEPTIEAGERPQTYDLDRAATGTGNTKSYKFKTSPYNNLGAR
jgi:hypothetical protein